jgi:excisionase family DNA binding protein
MTTTEVTTYVGWKAIAEALSTSTRTARRWAKKKGLPVYRLQGQVRIDREDMEIWVEHNRKAWAKQG